MVGKIFLTGGSGFLGGRLMRSLSSNGYEIYAFKGDIRDVTAIKRELEQEEFKAIIHAAGGVVFRHVEISHGGIGRQCRWDNEPGRGGSCNPSNNTYPIFEFGPGLCASSKGETRGFRESDPTLISGNLYATSKLIGERILQEFAVSASMNVISFRLFNHTHKSQAPSFFFPVFIGKSPKLRVLLRC
ncbi:MAG: NAD(P)-dependent oxidoreductase [Bdellovibrionales bacterium]|nr:NAD(P)-dependent oxidoreductase [Bdellovibrionales bacterium]